MKTELWRHAAPETTQMHAFMKAQGFSSYDPLYTWSLSDMGAFWKALWEWSGVIGDMGSVLLSEDTDMIARRFFPQASLNYAENLLQEKGPQDALVFWGEDKVKRALSWDHLRTRVARAAQGLRQAGVKQGDRVAALMPNTPETVIAMLAAVSIGAVWSSASPDFGKQGIVDRFGQIEPKVFLACDGYWYGGKWRDVTGKLAEVLLELPTVELAILVPYDGETLQGTCPENMCVWPKWLERQEPSGLSFTRVPFDHPLFIMFSSGTTGRPKCIVHGHGGTLLQHIKEQRLHCDIKPLDRVFYFTTCGWMMWNWLVSALACKATLLLYDGSPFSPNGNILFDYADAEDMTFFGTSAKYIDALKKEGLEPHKTHKLAHLRAMGSTGSVLVPESFDYVYHKIKSDIQLASISGGTDIVSCFLLGNPLRPVHRGELQGPGLGLAVEIWRPDGTPAKVGEKGELVCTKPFPCQPIGFWNDKDGVRYKNAYFSTFSNIWHHGDYGERTPYDGFILHGRSDATLNPGGVRIGTAEIYRQVEKIPSVRESVAVGKRQPDGDETVWLFVVMHNDAPLTLDLEAEIKTAIRTGASPRHVPEKVFAVSDIPRTKSGKISEIAVRKAIHGEAIDNTTALANAECIDDYRALAKS